jgi:hypothetical protein
MKLSLLILSLAAAGVGGGQAQRWIDANNAHWELDRRTGALQLIAIQPDGTQGVFTAPVTCTESSSVPQP